MKSDYNKLIKDLYSEPEIYINEFQNYKDDIYFWQKIMEKYNPGSVLEVGIGNGRLIELLHNKVKVYNGVDFSKKLIDYCNKKFNYKNVNLYNCDFKKFLINKTYDLIIFPFNVINNFYNIEDINLCFNNLKKLCNSNTKIVIETINPTITDLLDSDDFIKTNEFEIQKKIIELYESKKIDIINSTCIYKKKYICNGKVIKEYILPNRIFFHQELMNIIDAYDFEVDNLYGDYNLEKFDKTSRKQIFVIRRK